MKEIGISLDETLRNSNLKDFAKEIGEITIDSILKDGFVRDIPIINTISSFLDVGFRIKERIFAKKIIKFLSQLEDTTSSERGEVIKEIESKQSYGSKVGESLILIIEKMDDLEKPTIMGNLFLSLIKREIDYETFLRLSTTLLRIFTPDLYSLKTFYEGENIADLQLQNLSNVGLIKTKISRKNFLEKTAADFGSSNEKIEYEINEIGTLMVKFGLD